MSKKNKAPEGHPSVRKEDFKAEPVRNEQRLSSRNKKPFFSNFDYTEEGPDETSPGGGLYHGKMDKYKSVKDFREKKNKEKSKPLKISERRSEFLSLAFAGKTVKDMGENLYISPDVVQDLVASIEGTVSVLKSASADISGSEIKETDIEQIRDFAGNLSLLCNMIINGKEYSEEETSAAIHDDVGGDD